MAKVPATKRRTATSPTDLQSVGILPWALITKRFGKRKWVEFNTVEPTPEQVTMVGQLRRGKRGQCFANAQLAVVEAQTDRASYVEGYLLAPTAEPDQFAFVHHAWVVIDGKMMVDPTLTDLSRATIGRAYKGYRAVGVVFPRKTVVRDIIKADADHLECKLPELS